MPLVRASVSGGAVRVSTGPARPGATAVLQTYDRYRFAFVDAGTTRLDANGAARLPLPTGRKEHVRVLVRGRRGWSPATSAVFLVGAAR